MPRSSDQVLRHLRDVQSVHAGATTAHHFFLPDPTVGCQPPAF
jgi:hypothetical protein